MTNERIAVITGAGSGIGRATAIEFSRRGWTVALVGRNEQALGETLGLLAETTPPSSVLVSDVTKDAAPDEIGEALSQRYGRVDVLVNNAGALLLKAFDAMTPELFDDIWRINTRAPYLLALALLPLLRRSSSAAIVNISSAAGSFYRPGQSAYGTSKAAIDYLTRSLAVELAPAITVNGIIPGPVATAIHGGAADDEDGPLQKIVRTLPAGRAGLADEIARWVADVAAPDNRWMTGSLIPVDGGRIITPPDRPSLEELG